MSSVRDPRQHAMELARRLVGGLDGTHAELDERYAALGLYEFGQAEGDVGTKRERGKWAESQVTEDRALLLLSRLRSACLVPQEDRFAVDDVLDEDVGAVRVDQRSRREIARALDSIRGGWDRSDRLAKVVDEHLVPVEPPDGLLPRGFYSPAMKRACLIEQHTVRNEDWSTEDLFESMDAFTVPDRRFASFLSTLISHEASSDVAVLRRQAAAIDGALADGPLTFAEVGESEGYPTFELRRRGGHNRPPSLILFASREKPDLRMTEVLDRSVELLNRDSVLAYDRPVDGSSGLRWKHLLTWWSDLTLESDPERVKGGLYHRLAASIPATSPPQRALFDAYHTLYREAFAQGEGAALLPETWIHWDPRTVRDRGDRAFSAHRMDFLMLLPRGRRVVIEVDGIQHYSDSGGASPKVYAQTVRGDRDLRLDGYEVYRFGGWELGGEGTEATLREFFGRLLSA